MAGRLSNAQTAVSMIALGGPKLKLTKPERLTAGSSVSMIALGGPKLKPNEAELIKAAGIGFNDSTGWA